MASYLWSWWFGPAPPSDDPPLQSVSVSVSTPEETQELIDERRATRDEELIDEPAVPDDRHTTTQDTIERRLATQDTLARRPATQDTIERRLATQDTLACRPASQDTIERPPAAQDISASRPEAQDTIDGRRATVSISTPDEDDMPPDEDDDTPPAFPSLTSIQRTSRRAAVSISTLDDDDDDTPPPFPSLTSIQRTSADTTLIPPAPRNIRTPPAPRGTASTLMPPPRTPMPAGSASLMPPPATTRAPPARRGKVALAPGHSPLDWAALKASGADLRGVPALARITPAQLAAHRGDAWAAFGGRVYNLAPYLAFHPGGARELLRVAGRDGTRLFGLTHAWVNVEMMLDECLVGFLVPEGAGGGV